MSMISDMNLNEVPFPVSSLSQTKRTFLIREQNLISLSPTFFSLHWRKENFQSIYPPQGLTTVIYFCDIIHATVCFNILVASEERIYRSFGSYGTACPSRDLYNCWVRLQLLKPCIRLYQNSAALSNPPLLHSSVCSKPSVNGIWTRWPPPWWHSSICVIYSMPARTLI